eukprot:gene5190-5428_t
MRGLPSMAHDTSHVNNSISLDHIAADSLQHGNGLARQLLSKPGIEGSPMAFLKTTEAYWKAMKTQKHEPHKKGPTVVTTSSSSCHSLLPSSSISTSTSNGSPGTRHLSHSNRNNSYYTYSPSFGAAPVPLTKQQQQQLHDFDVIMCGGTLGMFVALALQQKGFKVAVVEKRLAQGRSQEWNTSRHELQVLVQLGLLTEQELESTIVTEFNPVRVGFRGSAEPMWVNDCLNLGVSPKTLIAHLRAKFEVLGGVVYEHTAFKAPSRLSCRLLLDCMGHYSPVVKQIRGRAKPDGMVLVVGGCATADMQLFWEAFPAEGGAARTTYMFAYSDADPSRPSFERLLDTYFALLPSYQELPGNSLDDIQFKRVLFGGFPCYSDQTPLKPGFDRVLQLGDASACQSPLSFGGFGSMLRHLPRLARAISHALSSEKLSRQDLSWIQPYQPSLAAAWLFQRSMSMGVGQQHQALQQALEAGGGSAGGGVAPGTAAAGEDAAAGYGPRLPDKWCNNGSGAGQLQSSGAASATNINNLSSSTLAHDASNSSRRSESAVNADSQAARSTVAAESALTSGTQPVEKKAGDPGNGGGSSTGRSWLRQLLLLPANHINALLGANFTVMSVLGLRVLKPFLQDTLQLGPLALTMFGMMLVKPLVITRVLWQGLEGVRLVCLSLSGSMECDESAVKVGPRVLLGWFGHFAALTAYTLAHHLLRPLRTFTQNFTMHRVLDALEYGSSSDYKYTTAQPVSKGEAIAAAAAAEGRGSAGSPQYSQQEGKKPVRAVNAVKRGEADGSMDRFAGWEAHLSGARVSLATAGDDKALQWEQSLQQQQLAGAGAGV